MSACPDVSCLSRCLALAQLTSPGLSKFPGPGPLEILSANIITSVMPSVYSEYSNTVNISEQSV